MIVTILLALMMMLGLFLMLWSGVGFIQDKRFFSSAPKEVCAAVQPKPERFRAMHALGWGLAALSLLLMGGALFLGEWNGIRNDFGFWQFFFRFLIMLWGLEAFDILFFVFTSCVAPAFSLIITPRGNSFSARICLALTGNHTCSRGL